MNDIIQFLNNLPLLNTILILLTVIGGFFAFKTGKRNDLLKFQKDTIDALQQRITTLEAKVTDFEKENVVQRHIIDTITSALKQRNMIITIDGDMVTIADSHSSTHRKRTITTTQAVVKKEEE